ncbi:hypothetical protein M747DRAFT_294166 [Aspergillus niger ATCC 13496]|uniref:Uncharacterized protein n=1 Tax=Aspergillus niger ATCC 13496 TaxID=1353008 RepID=A0A370C622_ASPNG|nr:hypothetical protein M747DRAFT_294166 [Aspergillus niger ATCC 13496]
MFDRFGGDFKSPHSKDHSGQREIPPRSILRRGSPVRLKPSSRHRRLTRNQTSNRKGELLVTFVSYGWGLSVTG